MTRPAPTSLTLVVALAVALCVALSSARAAHAEASDIVPYRVDLYTMGAGDRPFERFGHAAICVKPTRERSTECFNYGTTNFEDAGAVAWGFLRGQAKFWVSEWTWPTMKQMYVDGDRTIWRQRLRLPPEQAKRLYARLRRDVRPGYRDYLYHHFYDNCATRLRDVLDEATDGQLTGDGYGEARLGPSFREVARKGLADMPVALLLADIVLGRPADERFTRAQGMFLPELLRDAVTARFGVEPVVIHQRRGPAPNLPAGSGRLPFGLFAFGLAAVLAWAPLRSPHGRAARIVAGASLGLLGLLVWGLAAVSLVPELRYNEVVLAVWPTDVLLALPDGPLLRRYVAVRTVATLAVSVLWGVGALLQPLFVVLMLPAAVFGALELAVWRARDRAGVTTSGDAAAAPR